MVIHAAFEPSTLLVTEAQLVFEGGHNTVLLQHSVAAMHSASCGLEVVLCRLQAALGL